jgi:carbonic anhydrase
LAAAMSIDEMLNAAQRQADQLAAPDLSPEPRRRVAVLTCMDARIDPYRILGLDRGDAHIIRNAGGLVTDDVLRSLTISQHLLGTEDIVVMMHEDCGLQGGSEEELAASIAADGEGPGYRLGVFEDLDRALTSSLAQLRSTPTLRSDRAIRGFVFDPRTGRLREVSPPRGREAGQDHDSPSARGS